MWVRHNLRLKELHESKDKPIQNSNKTIRSNCKPKRVKSTNSSTKSKIPTVINVITL